MNIFSQGSLIVPAGFWASGRPWYVLATGLRPPDDPPRHGSGSAPRRLCPLQPGVPGAPAARGGRIGGLPYRARATNRHDRWLLLAARWG